MNESTTIAGIKIYNSSLSSLLSEINARLTTKDQPVSPSQGRRLTTILTANPEIVVQAQDDVKLMEILHKSWASIPDGMGILWAATMQNKTIAERITGVRLTQELLDIAQKEKLTVGVIGGTEQASIKYQKYLNTLIPNTQKPTTNNQRLTAKSWTLPGPWLDTTKYNEAKNELADWFESEEGRKFLDKLNRTDILFVAMGAPKQEYFIDFLSSRLTAHGLPPEKKQPAVSRSEARSKLFVAVGGTFDELSGIVPKTPEWASRVGLKWLHRLAIEPHRFKRQTRLLRFIRLIIK